MRKCPLPALQLFKFLWMDEHHFKIVGLGGFATWKVTVRSTYIIVHQLENVQETNMLGWEHNWIRHTRVWNSGIAASQTLSYKVYLGWQCEHLVFFAGDRHGFHCCFP
jgi:hypothetical protein